MTSLEASLYYFVLYIAAFETCFKITNALLMVLVKFEGSTLYITDAKPEDRGVYLCEVENTAGQSYASVVIEVESEFLILKFEICFKNLIKNLLVFRVTCPVFHHGILNY